MMLTLLLLVILFALVFEFINGFHDTANSIASVVATKVLTPMQAVALAAVMNLIGAFFGTMVAKTISSGIIDSEVVNVSSQLIICALSGAIYLVNDVADRTKDARHPTKRHRPIASGVLPVRWALIAAVLLMAGSLVGSFALAPAVGLVALAYAALLVAYSVRLKHVVILDVLAVASGFVLRAIAGAEAVDVDISGWLVICTILIALFLALG